MDLENLKILINEHVRLITIDAKGIIEAKERAGKFLQVHAILSGQLMELEVQIAKLNTLVTAQFATAVDESTGKSITEKKVHAERNPAYAQARENFEIAEAQRSWIKNYMKIFDNAHVMFRQYSREGQ